jgi:hypothetical protein
VLTEDLFSVTVIVYRSKHSGWVKKLVWDTGSAGPMVEWQALTSH